jgi:hypothetical protein
VLVASGLSSCAVALAVAQHSPHMAVCVLQGLVFVPTCNAVLWRRFFCLNAARALLLLPSSCRELRCADQAQQQQQSDCA